MTTDPHPTGTRPDLPSGTVTFLFTDVDEAAPHLGAEGHAATLADTAGSGAAVHPRISTRFAHSDGLLSDLAFADHSMRARAT